MYAIIEDGGKQYKVQTGELVCIDYRELPEGQSEVEFDKVLLVRDEDKTLVGQPTLAGAKVTGKINTAMTAGPKLYPMQMRRRKNSRRRIGHRQKYVEVEITGIAVA